MDPKWTPKWTQNGPKIYLKWTPKWTRNRLRMDQKWIQNGSQTHSLTHWGTDEAAAEGGGRGVTEEIAPKMLPRYTHIQTNRRTHTRGGATSTRGSDEAAAEGGGRGVTEEIAPKTLPRYRNIQTNRHTHTNTHVDTQTHRHADTQTQTPRRTYTHADKHTDRHAHKHTDTHKQYGHAVVVTRFPFITKTGLYFRSFLEVPKY